MLRVEKLNKSYSDSMVLKDVCLEVKSGEMVSIIGPSGCWKSTLLRCLNGLESIDAGEIHFVGEVLRSPLEMGENSFGRMTQRWRGSIGMVFQSYNLFSHMNVIENLIAAPCLVQKISRDDAISMAEKLLDKVGLKSKAERYPHHLSGGEQQRAAIARALAMSPKLMLYDEPTSALDPTLVDEVLGVMKQLDSEGMTQIVVTHEMRFARDVADRVVYVENGSVVEMGPPSQIFSSPEFESTRNYLRHFL